MKLAASLLTAVAVVPLFWFTVAPHGAELCASDVQFATPHGHGDVAAAAAKQKFCAVVTAFPVN